MGGNAKDADDGKAGATDTAPGGEIKFANVFSILTIKSRSEAACDTKALA